jgi:hypothetical protein
MGEAIDAISPVELSLHLHEASEVAFAAKDEVALPLEEPVRGIWRLPPEIRNAVYEELLVTDCAFRLGYALTIHLVPADNSSAQPCGTEKC